MRIRSGAGRAARATDAERAGRDALHLLAEGLCAVCRQRDDGARSWLRYFVNDSNADPGVRARVRDAVGFCPAHTRHLLGDTSASWLLPSVQGEALAGGLRLLDDDRARRGPCPACEAGQAAEERALVTVSRALPQAPVRDAVCGGALCLPHEIALAARSDAAAATAVTTAATERLTGLARTGPDDEGPGIGAGVATLAGLDADAAARGRQLGRLDPLLDAERAGAHAPVADRWAADLRLACCPLCLAEHRAARRLLRWAATSEEGRQAEGTSALCPRHLHDLGGLAGQAAPHAGALVAANAEEWRERLAGGSRPKGAPRCRACEEEQLAHARHAALLAAALRDPVRARAYQEAHGVCLRHVLRWDGPPPAPVDTVLRARLALLGWELAEARRKQDWRTRHEVKGAEMTSGSRAPTLLDGRAHAGSPAPGGTARTPDTSTPDAGETGAGG
ncbi:hypothetical protein [Streptomyces sp. B6B3]|uniref:hypothetical protein n=1 Tax=Streptomyces sp. B6B3 TaxID=3153570 RepID=UPI00325EB02D